MRPIRLSRRAERWFLKAIGELADINPVAARKLLVKMERVKTLLATFPEMSERGLIPGTRKVTLYPFILTIRRRGGTIEIAAIRYARQRDALAPTDLASGQGEGE